MAIVAMTWFVMTATPSATPAAIQVGNDCPASEDATKLTTISPGSPSRIQAFRDARIRPPATSPAARKATSELPI